MLDGTSRFPSKKMGRPEGFLRRYGSKTQVTGHCFTNTGRPKHYTKTILRLKVSMSKV